MQLVVCSYPFSCKRKNKTNKMVNISFAVLFMKQRNFFYQYCNRKNCYWVKRVQNMGFYQKYCSEINQFIWKHFQPSNIKQKYICVAAHIFNALIYSDYIYIMF